MEQIREHKINKRIKGILKSGKLNRSALARSTNISIYKFSDVLRGKDYFKQDEYIRVKKTINQIRVDGKKLVEAYHNKRGKYNEQELEKLRDFLENRELVIMKVFKLKKLLDFRLGKKVVLSPDNINQVVSTLSIFILETNLE